jgi:hypothetical protein
MLYNQQINIFFNYKLICLILSDEKIKYNLKLIEFEIGKNFFIYITLYLSP